MSLISFTSFKVGDTLLGIPSAQIMEVSRKAELSRLPFSAPHVLGLINLRGTLAVGIDLAKCLQINSNDSIASLWVFTQAHQCLLALKVDAVCDIHAVAAEELSPAPVGMDGHMGRIVSETVVLKNNLMHVIALNEIPLQSLAPGDSVLSLPSRKAA